MCSVNDNNFPAQEPLVSIIMPAYNSESFIAETIDSVIAQTYRNWELIIVDDCSTDETIEVLLRYSNDTRISIYQHETNKGPAEARNLALEIASGRYISYFDSDDLWLPRKLEKQIKYMNEINAGMCFTSYETINEDGTHRNNVHIPKSIDYKTFLKKPVTCTHTVVFDTHLIGKELLIMPNIRKRQDGATWLQVLRSGAIAYGLDEILAKNRKRAGSVSANKLQAMKYTWHLYHNIEGLSVPYAAYCEFWQLFHAVTKRIGRL